MKLSKNLCIAVAALGFSSSLLANQITLVNASPGESPLKFTYQLAHQNEHENTVLSEPKTLVLNKSSVIQVDLNNYQMAGIVAVAIDGHPLPSGTNEFGQQQKCSLALDSHHLNGSLSISQTNELNGHGTITCASHGGIHR